VEGDAVEPVLRTLHAAVRTPGDIDDNVDVLIGDLDSIEIRTNFTNLSPKLYTVTLDETLHVDYVGGVPTNRTTVDLRVRVEEWDGRATDWAFHGVSLGGRGGGNLTLAVRPEGDGLIVFWRWAYLPCDETFPNSYYVFHATFDGAGSSRDNDLVYFEAPRPRRGPPVDLILLVVAGLAVSVIFLLARHALKRNA